MALIARIIGSVRRLIGWDNVSFELSGEAILVRGDAAARELVHISDIHSWGLPTAGKAAVTIRLKDGRSIVVGDQRGALRAILEQAAQEKKITDQRVVT